MHDPLNLRLLSHFLAVVEAGSVSAAAVRLNLTQPALSRQIQQLERSIGVRLFERTPTRLILTSGGSHLVGLARELLDHAGDVGDALERMAAGGATRLRVACPEATVRGVIAPFVAATGAPIVDAAIDLAVRVYGHVSRREADLAVNTLPPPLGLGSKLVGTNGVSVFVPETHPLAGRETVGVGEAVAHPLVLLSAGSGLRRIIDEALWPVRERVRVVAEPVSSELVMARAASGDGVGIDLGRPSFGLVARPLVDTAGARVRMPIYAAWEPTHFAAAEIRGIVDELIAWGEHVWE
ncbi:LysR family transcriptional regulator [Leucobacter allii]|uniref:LysR family transcriptional regulator n=1 Tax=Leucobacter allii TaxID=2932247 RepID=A0ABY4FK83_9MICO|nr:LysR family transcriptional regulator [Leucobacter allii]UOQ56669.1 LysR family transcriptional regulator [Leucobacter allii]UOR01104.1 LysR family transcriptional regulator [Leucobacter allii]